MSDISRYRLASFASGFVLMVFELTGSRILAPTIGSSIYIWTSVIGVVIAALSVGFFLGGRLADQRGKPVDLVWILIITAALMLLTLATGRAVLSFLGSAPLDVRLQAVIASLLLFAPASLFLGAMGPYLAKLHTRTLKQTGRSIAMLDALNALGGITGTFLAGFIFFGYMGARQTLVFLIGILLCLSFLFVGRLEARRQIRIVGGIFIAALVTLLLYVPEPNVLATVETPSASYQVKEVIYEGEKIRVLTMGPGGYQSGVRLNGDSEPILRYAQFIAKGIDLFADDDARILVLGGGTFTLPRHLAETYPNATIDVVEIDPQLQEIAKQYFFYQPTDNIRIINEDGRTFVNRTEDTYDIVVSDAFGDTGIPFTFTTEQFAEAVYSLLNDGGIVIYNVIAADHGPCRPLLRSINDSFLTQFEKSTAIAIRDNSFTLRQNVLLNFEKNSDRWTKKLNGREFSSLGSSLTDDFAPVERLHHDCSGR